jgi:hypothetical protein
MAWPPSFTTRLVLLVVLAAVSVWETRLSLVTSFLTLVAIVSRAASSETSHRLRVWAMIAAAMLLSLVGFFRFVMNDAIPGVIAGGRAAAEKHAVAYLRTIVAAQDYMRRSAHIDPDGDGVGSAASLAELTGKRPLRGGATLPNTPLYISDDQWFASGVVSSGAYLYRVCLPAQDGGWTDPAESNTPIAIDEERAERQYLVYGWPKMWIAGSPTAIYVSDAYEAIRVLETTSTTEPTKRYAGEHSKPPCDLAVTDPQFRPWNAKTPRAQLPGDAP